jgi:ABC-type transport system involved in cytochrome bd biosynthesis fused ATPase/permease subunit
LLQEGGRPLSGGELKRLAIARAFLRSPSFYLMDEVFAGVDSEMTRRILDSLKEHAQKINAGIIHITHDENIKARCDQTIDLMLSR